MAKGRFLSATIAMDGRLNGLSLPAEYVYLKCIPHLDRDGLILCGSGSELWAQVCPRRAELLPQIAGFIQEFISAGLVTRYQTPEGDVLYFHGFAKNQAGMRYDREAASRFDAPPGYIRNDAGLTPDEVRQDSGNAPDEVLPKFKYKDKSKFKGNAPDGAAHPPAADDVSARYSHMVNAIGQTGNYGAQPEKFRGWFAQTAMTYGRTDFDTAVSKMATDYRNDDMGGQTVWQRTEQYLRAAAVSSNGHGPKLILYVDPVAPEGLT